jgi:hypothetical protein
MAAIEERISDRHVLKLLRAMLRAGVMEDGAVHRDMTGTPQGGVISPVLANVYLHRLDRQWQARGRGVLVRYADDLVVMCRSRREAEAALTALRSLLAELGLELKQAKTRIVHLREGGEGLDFLGFHHRRVRGERGYRHLTFLARWPSREAMQRARSRIREITNSKRLPRSGRSDRAGAEYVPARLGGLLPLRKLPPSLHQDQHLRAQAAGPVCGEAPQPGIRLRHDRRRLPVAQPPGADQPRRNRRHARSLPGLAGEVECRR